ncbi:MAG: phage baseplate assembly protein V [Cyanobacteria bacterium J06607_6]
MTGTLGNNGDRKYYGKYAGTVLQNIDPEQRGRIQVSVPDALSLVPSSWAEPCIPLAGPTGTPMGSYFVPPIGTSVWVEFEKGDIERPIWVGCRFGSVADVPPLALAGLPISPSIVLQTGGQNTFMISDLPGPTGGILLKTTAGASISVTDTGIIIQNGRGASISMVGPTVTINNGALTIT